MQIKQIIWDEGIDYRGFGDIQFNGETSLGDYIITFRLGPKTNPFINPFHVDQSPLRCFTTRVLYDLKTLDEAKSVCQSEFNDAVSGCIELEGDNNGN